MPVNWDDLLLTWLHDPPDKAYAINARDSIPAHESRRLDLAKAVLGDDSVSQRRIKEAAAQVDVLAAQIERLPMPRGVHVNIANDVLIVHPLSGKQKTTSIDAWTQELLGVQRDTLKSVTTGLKNRARFLATWRMWPDELAKGRGLFAKLPAETRNSDHTIWHHLDITAAFKAALSENGGPALLAVALGPVQRFIEAARTVRDLWSGSMVLSWLAFQAMLPIIEQLGPTALVYPALRGNPMLDLWLRDPQRVGEKVPLPDVELRRTPALPHRFLALVPWGKEGACAKDLAGQCQKAAADAWREMAQAVRQRICNAISGHCSGWDKRWDSQIESYFSATTALMPLGGSGEDVDQRLARLLTGKELFKEAFPNAEAVREMTRAILASDRPGYDQDHAGRWQYQVELVQRSLAAQRSIRHVPPNPPANAGQRFPQKCTLLGSFEQMGPDDLRRSKEFWDQVAAQNGLNIDGVRVRQGEALCAVAMVKRFATPAFLRGQLQLSMDDLRFPDTWTVAAAEWLKQANIDWRHDWGCPWNGTWLQSDYDLDDAGQCPSELLKQIEDARKPEKCGAPPVYYAILKLDGDDLGGWLRGEKSPKVREVMHPDLVQYYQDLGQAARSGLDAKRPVGPALHAAISTALANFALHVVPHIVAKHHGTVIYSGGDDTLALLPASTALRCALELQQAYTADWYRKDHREYLMMGSRATLSGGLVVVHAKDDLRLALQDARRGERQAKESGRDTLAITVRRRSGEHTTAVCPWSFVPTVTEWTSAFQQGASDRWAYHLYANRPTLEKLPEEAIKAEMRRQVARAEEPTPSLIPPNQLADTFDTFRSSTVAADSGMRPRFEPPSLALHQFLTLCHTASFLARGRDG